MRKVLTIALASMIALTLTGCGGTSSVDIKQVLIRTADTFDRFDRYMTRYSYKSMTPQLFAQLTIWLNQEMNRSPALHAKRIATRINKNASIDGHSDHNGNGKVDAAEPRLFKIEIDTDKRRIIATAEGGSSYGYRPGYRSFMGGYLVGGLLGQQRRAGIRYGHFAKRSVYQSGIRAKDRAKDRASTATARNSARRRTRVGYRSRRSMPRSRRRTRYSNARSRTRSGGVFGGK